MACSKHWILDGYNVMHALAFLRPDIPFDIARECFTGWVGQFQSLGDKQVTIVFDDNVHMPGPHEIHPRVHTIYSPEGFNADGTILSIVRQTPEKIRSTLVVVTRDLMLRDALFAYHCMVISPDAFAKEFDIYRSHVKYKDDVLQNSKDRFYKPFKEFFDESVPTQDKNHTEI